MLDLADLLSYTLGRGYGASIRGKVQNRATDLGWAELPSVLRWVQGSEGSDAHPLHTPCRGCRFNPWAASLTAAGLQMSPAGLESRWFAGWDGQRLGAD